MIEGINASTGIAIGKALVINEKKLEIEKQEIKDLQKENERFNEAVEIAKNQLKSTVEKTLKKLGEEKSKIFEAHLLMLDDPEFTGTVSFKIINEAVNAEYALKSTADELVAIFEQLNNEYMRERAADIKDVTKRIISILVGSSNLSLGDIDEQCIIISDDLTPSDTAQIDKNYVLGFVTKIGGSTSHSAIIARSMGIPAILGVGDDINKIKNDDLVIVDGNCGIIIVNPDENTLNKYKLKLKEEEDYKKTLEQFKYRKSVTLDNKEVEVASNIGSVEDIKSVLENGADGIGLFRTEFLYMEKNELPDEEMQFNAYKEVLEKMNNKPVIIRTLDIGGDKKLPYLNIGSELNPFLGYRAIRLCLDRIDIFKTQLRALLRASKYGNLRIMFPMISNVQEFREAKKVLNECMEELKKQGIEYDENVEVGIMIEIPSAAIMSDVLAKEVDFFSIGTNDLIQYTSAVDRMNEKISYLYDFFNPAVLRLIKTVIDNGHKEGKFVGMCGEMAGNITLIPLLLGMGLDEFSMSASSVLSVRKTIVDLSYEKCKDIVKDVMNFGTSDEIKAYLNKNLGCSI